MKPRDRVAMTLNFEEPDTVPIWAEYVPEVRDRLRKIVGTEELDLGVAMGNDLVCVSHGFVNGAINEVDEEYIDAWGCRRKKIYTGNSIYNEIVERPLANPSNLIDYKIPDPINELNYILTRKIIDKYNKDYWIGGSIRQSIFECAWGLRGMEELIIDMIDNKDFVHELMDKVMEFPRLAGHKLIQLGVDMLFLGDDVAMQTGMMISPKLWREFLKPRYQLLINEYKTIKPDIKIAFHSCGNCEAIIDDLIEIGLDVLHPIQPKTMMPLKIKKRYGNNIVLWGTLDVQEILPCYSPAQIEEEVKRLINDCAPNGGFILSPAHAIQADTSTENILAFYRATRNYGKYSK